MDRRIQRILDTLAQPHPTRRGMKNLAQSVNLSTSRLRHLFKVEVGTSLGKYLKSIQMQLAKRILESSFLNVKEVGFAAGFADETHFIREFKKAYGVTPGRFRLRLKGHRRTLRQGTGRAA